MNATIYHLTQNFILTPNGGRDLEYWDAKIIRSQLLFLELQGTTFWATDIWSRANIIVVEHKRLLIGGSISILLTCRNPIIMH